MRTPILAFALSALTLASACGGGSKKETAPPAPVAAEPAAPAPAAGDPAAPAAGGDVTCAQLADHIVETALASEDYKNAKPEEQKQMQQMMPQVHDQIVQDCTEKSYSAEVKACFMNAATFDAMKVCGAE